MIDLIEKDASIGAVQPKVLSQRAKEYFEHAGAAGGIMDKWGYPFCKGRIFDKVEKDLGNTIKSLKSFGLLEQLC